MNIHIPTPLRTYTGGLETVTRLRRHRRRGVRAAHQQRTLS